MFLLKLILSRNLGITVAISYLNNVHVTENKLRITTSDFWCFTDAKTYHPVRINVTMTDDPLLFNVNYIGYGFYWCNIINTTYFEYYESDRIMFIESIESLFSVYVATLQFDYFDDKEIYKNNSNYFYEKLQKSR